MLKREIMEQVDEAVHLVYVDRQTAKWWNERMKPGDVRQFCGWYWVRSNQEAGPFKTHSAAARDAFYRFVKHQQAPSIGRSLAYGGSTVIKRASHR